MTEGTKDNIMLGAFLVSLLMVAVVMFHFGDEYASRQFKTEAAERGYAEWKVDTQGKSTWAWKEKQ